MSKTETKSRAGTNLSDGLSPVHEVKTAFAGFVHDLKDFQNEMNSKLQQQEERLTMLDRKSVTLGRPALAAAADAGAPHQKAFEAYVRSGDDDGLRGLELEGKAMSTAVAADGGYLVDPETSAAIKSAGGSCANWRRNWVPLYPSWCAGSSIRKPRRPSRAC